MYIYAVVTNIKRNECRLFHSGISISKKAQRFKLFSVYSVYCIPRAEDVLNTTILLCASMEAPWALIPQLIKWTDILEVSYI